MGGFSILSRRRLLKAGLGAGGLVLMGGGGVWALRGSAPAVSGLKILTGHEYRTLCKLAEVALPDSEVFPVGAGQVDLARAFDAYLNDEPPWNIGDLKRALLLLEFGPLLFDRRLKTFSNLGPEERLAHFQSWSVAPSQLRRVVASAFRRFLLLVFYDSPGVWPHLGYEGPLIAAAQAP